MSLAPLAAAPLIIQIHTFAALLALAAGIAVMLMPKGRGRHLHIGYVFAIGMLVTAISSLWIMRGGHYSWIHLLTVLTLVTLPVGIIQRRRGNIQGHKRSMIFLFLGVAIAGIFTLMPGRILHAVAFGTP